MREFYPDSSQAWAELYQALDETTDALTAAQDDAKYYSEQSDEWERKADMYRRQLGGVNAALNRGRGRVKDLEELCRSMFEAWEGGYPLLDDYREELARLGLREVR